MAQDSIERKSGYAAMSPLQKVFVWVRAGMVGFVFLRVTVGDLYYVSDNRTFICNEVLCFQKGYAVPYANSEGKEFTRYYCPSHAPPETEYVHSRDWFFESPSLVGTMLCIGFPGWLICVWLKRHLGRRPLRHGGL